MPFIVNFVEKYSKFALDSVRYYGSDVQTVWYACSYVVRPCMYEWVYIYDYRIQVRMYHIDTTFLFILTNIVFCTVFMSRPVCFMLQRNTKKKNQIDKISPNIDWTNVWIDLTRREKKTRNIRQKQTNKQNRQPFIVRNEFHASHCYVKIVCIYFKDVECNAGSFIYFVWFAFDEGHICDYHNASIVINKASISPHYALSFMTPFTF